MSLNQGAAPRCPEHIRPECGREETRVLVLVLELQEEASKPAAILHLLPLCPCAGGGVCGSGTAVWGGGRRWTGSQETYVEHTSATVFMTLEQGASPLRASPSSSVKREGRLDQSLRDDILMPMPRSPSDGLL